MLARNFATVCRKIIFLFGLAHAASNATTRVDHFQQIPHSQPKIRQIIASGSAHVVNPYHYDEQNNYGTNESDEVVYSVESDDPTQITVIGSRDTFVCFDRPNEESGCTDSVGSRSFILSPSTAKVVPVYYTGPQRDRIHHLAIKLVPRPCESTRVSNISVTRSRFDPPFHPYVYSYYARLSKREVYAYVDLQNTSTRCTYQIEHDLGANPLNVQDHQGIYVNVLDNNPVDLIISCNSASGTKLRYVVTMVYSDNHDDLLLRDLRPRPPLHFMQPFQSETAAPLKLSLQWNSPHYLYLLAETRHESVTVFLDDVPFERSVAHSDAQWDTVRTSSAHEGRLLRSPTMIVDPGESAIYKVIVMANRMRGPNRQEYTVVVERPMNHITSYIPHTIWLTIAWCRLLASSLLGATVRWTQTVQNLQFISFSGMTTFSDTHSRPEIFDAIAADLHCPFLLHNCAASSIFNFQVQHMPGAPDKARHHNVYSWLRHVEPDGEDDSLTSFNNRRRLDNVDLIPPLNHDDSGTVMFDEKESFIEIQSRRLARTQQYLITIELLTIIITISLVLYSVIYWFSVRRKNHLFRVRQAHPNMFHPATFFLTLFDVFIIVSTQVCSGLMMDPPTISYLDNRSMAPREVQVVAFVALMLGPILGYCLIAVVYYRYAKVIFSSATAAFAPPLTTHIACMYSPFRGFPILEGIFEMKISNAVPINGTNTEDIPHVHMAEEQIPFTETKLFHTGIRAIHVVDPNKKWSIRVDPKVADARVYVNSSLYFSSKTNVRVAKYYGRFSKAHVGQRAFTLCNQYDWHLTIKMDLQLGHMDAITHIFDNYALHVPIRQFDSVPYGMTYAIKQLYEHAPKYLPNYYLIDRGGLMVEIILAHWS